MKLKGFVCTKSHLEGSMAEGYVFDEALTFCSSYLQGCDTIFNRKCRNDAPRPMYLPCHVFNKKGAIFVWKAYSDLGSQVMAASTSICFVQL